jgi:tetratricopeptide (TPR) repeat protein
VFIYLSRSHVASALQRLGHALRLGGWLVLGASDLVYSLPPDLVADYERGRLVFRRAETAPTAAGVPLVGRPKARSIAPVVLRPVPRASAPPNAPPENGAHVSMLVTQANQHLDAGQHAHALSLYEAAQRLDPLAPEPYFFAGVAHHKEGQLDSAVHRFRSSLFLQPTLWPASLYLALCYERMARTEEASHEYRRVVEAIDTPLRFRSESSLCHDLEHWRQEVVTLARRRARRKAP